MMTLRELQVMELASEGWTDQEIADSLHLSIHTVKQHIANALKKLEARNRTHAVAICLRGGLIT